ncbi:MAG: hypothetical protein WBX09_00810, partial [Terracidiphilus sp.]
LHEWPNIFPLKVTQISHAFGLLQLPAQSKPLLPRYIGETGSSALAAETLANGDAPGCRESQTSGLLLG